MLKIVSFLFPLNEYISFMASSRAVLSAKTVPMFNSLLSTHRDNKEILITAVKHSAFKWTTILFLLFLSAFMWPAYEKADFFIKFLAYVYLMITTCACMLTLSFWLIWLKFKKAQNVATD